MPVYDPFSEVIKGDEADGAAGASDLHDEYKYEAAAVSAPVTSEIDHDGLAHGDLAASAEATSLTGDDDGVTDEQQRSRAMLAGLKRVYKECVLPLEEHKVRSHHHPEIIP